MNTSAAINPSAKVAMYDSRRTGAWGRANPNRFELIDAPLFLGELTQARDTFPSRTSRDFFHQENARRRVEATWKTDCPGPHRAGTAFIDFHASSCFERALFLSTETPADVSVRNTVHDCDNMQRHALCASMCAYSSTVNAEMIRGMVDDTYSTRKYVTHMRTCIRNRRAD